MNKLNCFEWVDSNGIIYYAESKRIRRNLKDAERIGNMLVRKNIVASVSDYNIHKIMDEMRHVQLNPGETYLNFANLRSEEYGEIGIVAHNGANSGIFTVSNNYMYYPGGKETFLKFGCLEDAIEYIQRETGMYTYYLKPAKYGKQLGEPGAKATFYAVDLFNRLDSGVDRPYELGIAEGYLGQYRFTPLMKLFPKKRFMICNVTSALGDTEVSHTIAPTTITCLFGAHGYVLDKVGKEV